MYFVRYTCIVRLVLGFHGVFQTNVPIRLLGTRFETRNCISEPCPQESYWDIVFETPCSLLISQRTDSVPTTISGGVKSDVEVSCEFPMSQRDQLWCSARTNLGKNSTIRFESGIDPSTKRRRHTIRVNAKPPYYKYPYIYV
jgi:hypothetical protein